MAEMAYLEDAYGVTAELAGYKPLPQVGGESFGKDDYACTADRCARIDELSREIVDAGVEGITLQGGGARKRSRRRSRSYSRSATRRRQRGGRRKGRFTVNARIRIRLPRH